MRGNALATRTFSVVSVRTGLATVLAVTLIAAPSAMGSNFGDQAAWITEASNTILTQMPNVDAFMWFNNAKAGEPNWQIVPDAPGLPNPAVKTAYNNAWGNLSRGVFIDGNPDASTTPAGMAKIDYFESHMGQQNRVGWYESFSGGSFPLSSVQAADANGSRPYIVWQPYDDSIGYGARGNQSLLPLINSGDYDGMITQWATAAAGAKDSQNNPIQMDISFGHEMNGNWFSWGYLADDFYNPGNDNPITDPNTIGHNSNTPAAFASAFQRVVNIFNNVGATNVSFVWDVNADYVDNFTIAYPGDNFVDRMGMNGFNWGQRQRDPADPKWDDWREFSDIFDNWGGFSTYATLASLNDDLPIIIGEFGTNTPEPATLVFLALGGLAIVRRTRH